MAYCSRSQPLEGQSIEVGYPLVRIDKLHPDGSPRASLYGYRLPDRLGVTRVIVPPGTRRIHVNGLWRHDDTQVFAFDPGRRYVVTCWWSDPAERGLYVDIAREMRLGRSTLRYVDLYLDVIVQAGAVREKDEELLDRLDPIEAAEARATRDEVRRGIERREPLLDPAGELWSVPDDALGLRPKMRRRSRAWLAGRA